MITEMMSGILQLLPLIDGIEPGRAADTNAQNLPKL